jgi:hypothetical protein
MTIEDFDIIEYFEENQIDYHKSGEENVTRGWVNIDCPDPDCDDNKWHCGINLKSKLFSCYKCGNKGGIRKLVTLLEKCSWFESGKIIETFQNPLSSIKTEEKPVRHRRKMSLPKEIIKEWPDLHLNYLKKNNYDPDVIIPKYSLYPTGKFGKYKFRIIIPIIMDNRLVNFTSRDVSGLARIKYYHAPEETILVGIRGSLYNLDNTSDSIILVEGPADVWRLGNNSVATFGVQVTTEQIHKLTDKGFKNIFVMFDGEKEATNKAYEVANRLEPFVDHTEVIEMAEGDPGELSDEDVRNLKKELKL